MSRIARTFARLKVQNRAAFIPYITSGDPSQDHTIPLMNAAVEAGADILELGVPFSDPMADGPVIQKATERALSAGESLKGVLAKVSQFRLKNDQTPIVLMGYLNPIEAMGYEAFVTQAHAAGVDGILVVDMPPEEAHPLVDLAHQAGLDMIFLMTPTTPDSRLEHIKKEGSGFAYYVSLKGVTGSSNSQWDEVERKVKHLKEILPMPIGVGFGVRSPQEAQAIARYADGVIIGSSFVRLVEENAQKSPEELAQVLKEAMRPYRI